MAKTSKTCTKRGLENGYVLMHSGTLGPGSATFSSEMPCISSKICFKAVSVILHQDTQDTWGSGWAGEGFGA
jgi:hypothetical protein